MGSDPADQGTDIATSVRAIVKNHYEYATANASGLDEKARLVDEYREILEFVDAAEEVLGS